MVYSKKRRGGADAYARAELSKQLARARRAAERKNALERMGSIAGSQPGLAKANNQSESWEDLNMSEIPPHNQIPNPNRSKKKSLYNRVGSMLPFRKPSTSIPSTSSTYTYTPTIEEAKNMARRHVTLPAERHRRFLQEQSDRRASARSQPVVSGSNVSGLAQQLLQKYNDLDFEKYRDHCMNNWTALKEQYGGIKKINKLSPNKLKNVIKEHVVYLSNVSDLKKMLEITQKHAPNHFLAKLLMFASRGDDGGSKDFIDDAEAQEFANGMPDPPSAAPSAAPSELNLPDAPTFNPRNRIRTRTPSRASIMRATGGRRLRQNRVTRKRKGRGKKIRTRRRK